MSEFVLYKQDGKVTNLKVLEKSLETLKNGKYLVTFKSIRKRTLPQNAYLHGVVIPMVFEGLRNAGYNDVKDNEDAKLVIKTLFLKRHITNEKTGEVIPVVRDTHELTTVEFNAFLEDVWQWASTYLGINIPAPGEQTALFDKPIIAEYDFNNDITIVQ